MSSNRGNRLFFNGGRFHHDRFGFHHRCFGGFPCRDNFFLNSGLIGFPFFGSPLFDPFYSDSYFQQEPQQVVVSSDNNSSDLQLATEIQHLSDEIEFMREQQAQQAAAPRAQPQGSLSARSPSESTTFVFRDGHRVSTQNYAIVGDTLWVLNEHTAKKVPLADLDRAATQQVNAANGVDLNLPQ